MKPFNLEEAKAGKPVVTRDGIKVEILKFDLKGDYPIAAIIHYEKHDDLVTYYNDGYYLLSEPEGKKTYSWPQKRKPDGLIFMMAERWVKYIKQKKKQWKLCLQTLSQQFK